MFDDRLYCTKKEKRTLPFFNMNNEKEKKRMLMMTSRREINKHRRKSECKREKNRHMHTSGKAISVIKTDEK